jgi:tetratricopeptide (TPR) repeat protein
VLSVIAVLPIAADPLAFVQTARGGSDLPSPEAEGQAESFFQNALLLSGSEEFESARVQMQEAMRIWVRRREPGKAAKAALQMGNRYKQAGKYQAALNYYQLALDIKSAPGVPGRVSLMRLR